MTRGDFDAAVADVPSSRSVSVQSVHLVRHAETEWSLSGRHTSTTDLPLTERGLALARRLEPVLAREHFTLVLTSPLQRARRTCELSGLGGVARVDPDLVEWNYGEFEGLTQAQILERVPGWNLFRDGCPGGETPEDVAARADRVIARVRNTSGLVALFAHGHIFRVLVARWLALPAAAGSQFLLDTATLSVLSYYRGTPAVKQWNAEVPSPAPLCWDDTPP